MRQSPFRDDAQKVGVRPKETGLVCVACDDPVAIIENKLQRTLVMFCPACKHYWSVDEPGTPRH